MLKRAGDSLRRDRALKWRRDCDSGVVEQVIGEADIGSMQGLIDQQPCEPRAVDEQVACDGLALLRTDRCDRSLVVEGRVRDVTALVSHATLKSLSVQELPEKDRIEVVAVPDVEWEV